jgi:hypothetical protein
MINSTREIFYARQKKFNLFEKLANRLPKPRRLPPDHLYCAQQRDANILLKHGQVVMACVAEADPTLMKPGKSIGEANIVYSTDELFEQMPSLLANIAITVTSIRENQGLGTEYTILVDCMDGKTNYRLDLPIPKDICYDKEAYLTTVYVNPKHLPLPMLYRGFFPILICPERTPHVMVLPSHYWSQEMKDAWLEKRKESDE